jgi:hypothetical protein
LSVGIKYWDRGSWADYMKTNVLQLYESTLTIHRLWWDLREIAHGKLLSDIIKDIPTLEYVFVGGTSPPDEYKKDSLALIYRRLLGTSVKLREYYFLKSHGKEPKTLCNVEVTKIILYIDHIRELLERVLTHARNLGLVEERDIQDAIKNSRDNAKKILTKPESIVEEFVKLLNRALNLTVNYNEYTRFIWYLRKIPKKYMREYYPELLRPEVFRFIQEFLGLREYIVPRVDDPEIADLYTIYSFDHAVEAGGMTIDGMYINPEYYLTGGLPLPQVASTNLPYKTIGGCLCRVNELIWGLLRHNKCELELIVKGDVPNPFEEWQKAVRNVEFRFYSSLKYPESYEDLSMLDEILPAIFVGKAELVKSKYDHKLLVIWRW